MSFHAIPCAEPDWTGTSKGIGWRVEKKENPTTITDPAELENELDLTRQGGYAIDNGEHQPGLRCIGAPIRNQAGAVFAGISVSAPAWQMPPAEVDELNKVVIYHANLISQRLGYVR